MYISTRSSMVAAVMSISENRLSVSRQGVVFALALVTARALAGYTGILAAQAIADALTALLAAGLFYTQLYRELK